MASESSLVQNKRMELQVIILNIKAEKVFLEKQQISGFVSGNSVPDGEDG